MSYDFSSLSHPDFESLCLDLAGAHAGLRFEAFSPGPDGGIDGRHAKADEMTILQVKHYRGSRFSDLTRAMRHERASIEELQPTRYILATSYALTPDNKAALAEIIGSSLQSESDIVGPAELNRLLRENRNIENGDAGPALQHAKARIRALNSETPDETPEPVPEPKTREPDKFTDTEIFSLFSTLRPH